MIQGILITFGYLIISFFADLFYLGVIGYKIKNMGGGVRLLSEEYRYVSPVPITFSATRVFGLFYLIHLLYNKEIPIILFIAIAALEIYRGASQMLNWGNTDRQDMANYYTAKTIGSFIGLALAVYGAYFIR